MTSCFVRPTPQQLYQQLASMFSANVLGGAPIIPESNEYYLLGNDLAATELFYSLSAQQWEQTQDATACCEALIAKNAPLGLIPFAASFSNVYIAVSGPANDPIPSNLSCQIGSNTYNISQATNANPATLDTSGNAIILMTSLVPGAQVTNDTNIAIAQIGTLASVTATISIVPAGWNSDVVPQGLSCGGADAETCDQFRARVIDRKTFQPNADFSYIQRQALSWPCVTRVFQRTCGDCCDDGQMELYAFMDNSFPNGIVPATALPGLNTFIFGSTPGLGLGKAPVGIFGKFYEVHPLKFDINLFNAACLTGAQFTKIKKNLQALFNTFTPGQAISSKWIDTVIISVNPNCAEYILQITPEVTGLSVVDCFGNIQPNCDYLPLLGNVTYSATVPQP